jgi:hypothetical protein
LNYLLGLLSLLSALVLTGTAVSLFALRRAQRILSELKAPQPSGPLQVQDPATKEVREAMQALAVQVQDLQRAATGPAVDPAIPRPGLNLNKRSQALRMHRHGESPEQIAVTLQLPRQEVDLLLKVHRIVLSRV